MTLRRFWAICLVIALMGLTACAEVQPWERGRLAKPHMALDPDRLLSGIDAHTFGSKEGASGGIGPAGGGCGCN